MSNVSFIESLDQFERDEFGRYLIHDCVVDVGIWPGVVGNEPWINSICTRNPGKGNASRALDTLVLLSDKHTVPLMLCVSPLTQKQKRILSKTNLISWYKRHGFKQISHSYMRYENVSSKY